MIDPGFFPHRDFTTWGNAVQRAVPSGEQLLVPPSAVQVRMATRRAVVVDCKYGPYGGPAWQEYRARIEALGGFSLCFPAGPDNVPRELSADELVSVARRYGADYIVLRTDQAPGNSQATALRAQGWQVLVERLPGAPFELLRAPWV
jgi:hypothetical protein